MTATSEFTCLLDYYATRRAYRYLLHACSTTLTTAPAHPEARFYRAFALCSEGSASEAIRELESLIKENNGNGDYTLAATAAIIAAYKSGRGRTDKEGVERWKEQLKALTKTSDPSALLHAGRYFLHARKDKQAKQCLEKLLAKQPNHAQAATYLATLNARTNNVRLLKKALGTVDAIVNALAHSKAEHKVDINASLLAYLLHSARRDHATALSVLNSVIVAYPSFTPALIEKAAALVRRGQLGGGAGPQLPPPPEGQPQRVRPLLHHPLLPRQERAPQSASAPRSGINGPPDGGAGEAVSRQQ